MLDFGRSLPKLRDQVERDLRRRSISRERVLACAVWLLDRGFFRIGSEDYAEDNESYGIATMRKRHVTLSGARVAFDYEAKGGKRQVQVIGDRTISGLVKKLRQRRGGATSCSPIAMAGSGGHPLDDINEYIKGVIGEDHSQGLPT
jgi:DNA topoisomerase IB